MASSKAKTVEEYLRGLPEDRRDGVSMVREVILEHLPAGYQETMNWGMISYEVPLDRYPDNGGILYSLQKGGRPALGGNREGGRCPIGGRIHTDL